MRYAIVTGEAGKPFSVYVPDLPGRVATGATVGGAAGRIWDAMPVPEPRSLVRYVDA